MTRWQTYRDILAKMPPAEQVMAESYGAYPDRPGLASISARATFEGLYLAARYAMEALVERVEREDKLRADPPEPDEPEIPTHDEGDPVGHLADDPEASDVGRTPRPGSDATRRDLRGELAR